MLDTIQYQANWWLPNNPNKNFFGILHFTYNNGGKLELFGSFQDRFDTKLSEEFSILLGLSFNGKFVTLYKCAKVGIHDNFPGGVISTYYIKYIFVGHIFQHEEELKFKCINIQYSYLDEWIGSSGFSINYDGAIMNMRYEIPKNQEFQLNNNFKIKIAYSVNYPQHNIVQKDAYIKQTAFISIISLEPISYENFIEMSYLIQNFLNLGILEPVYPVKIIASYENMKTSDKKGIEIYHRIGYGDIELKDIKTFEMFFTFLDIKNNFREFLNNWVEKNNKLRTTYDLFFSLQYNPKMYLQQQFLNLTQGIETYHRCTYYNAILPEEKHAERIINVLNVVDKKYKKWLELELAYSNEPSLRQRLKDIYKMHEDIFKIFVTNKKEFINNVIQTRNYLTHYDKKNERTVMTGIELNILINQLKLMLHIILLKEIGFSDDKIKCLITKSRNILSFLDSSELF